MAVAVSQQLHVVLPGELLELLRHRAALVHIDLDGAGLHLWGDKQFELNPFLPTFAVRET